MNTLDRRAYYEAMQDLARGVRAKHGICTAHFGLKEMRRIYSQEGIRLDLWPHKMKKVRAAYLSVEGEPHVLLNKAMKPVEPRLFALAHELKHHLVDRDLAKVQPLGCAVDFGSRSLIEIGAEVFAAEFIFPVNEFATWVSDLRGGRKCTPDDIVFLKRNSPAKVSYSFIVKRLEWLRLVDKGQFRGFQFLNHERRLHGWPPWRRGRRRAT